MNKVRWQCNKTKTTNLKHPRTSTTYHSIGIDVQIDRNRLTDQLALSLLASLTLSTLFLALDDDDVEENNRRKHQSDQETHLDEDSQNQMMSGSTDSKTVSQTRTGWQSLIE